MNGPTPPKLSIQILWLKLSAEGRDALRTVYWPVWMLSIALTIWLLSLSLHAVSYP